MSCWLRSGSAQLSFNSAGVNERNEAPAPFKSGRHVGRLDAC